MSKCAGDVTKLPKWAQEHILDLQRKAETSKSVLDDYHNDQKESPIYFDEIVCDTDPPRSLRRYINGCSAMSFTDGLVVVDVLVSGDRQGVEVRFASARRAIGEASLFPQSSNSIAIRAATEVKG